MVYGDPMRATLLFALFSSTLFTSPVWADDDEEEQGDNHATFKLSAAGEAVYLSDSDFNIYKDKYLKKLTVRILLMTIEIGESKKKQRNSLLK